MSRMTKIVLSFLIALQASASLAQNASSATAKETTEKEKNFSLRSSLGHSTSLYDYQDGTKSSSLDISLVPSFKFTKNKTLTVSVAGSQDLIDPERSGIADISISMGLLSTSLGKHLNTSLSGSVVVPTSKDSLVRQEMQGAIGLSYMIQVSPDVLFSKNLGLVASVSATGLFHKYETAVDGSVNNKYSSRQMLGVSYQLGTVSFEVNLIHRNAWSYFGNLKEAYAHSEELGWQMNKQFSLALGHTLEGSVYKANGLDSNVKLIDDNNSIVYGALNYVY